MADVNTSGSTALQLSGRRELFIKQARELAELFGFETRNKYVILDESGMQIGFAAEQQKGFLGMLLRQLAGHWRSFDIQIFDLMRQPVARAHHPFRFFFQRLEVYDQGGRLLGAVQQRWAFFSKRFDVHGEQGQVIMEVSSPIWKPWTFPFRKSSRTVATVAKKWSGALTELFTDKDKFKLEFEDGTLSEHERMILLAAALFIDLQYFERKAQ